MITEFTMEEFGFQIIVSKTQKGNGKAEGHNNSDPLFFTETEALCLLNVIKPKNDGLIKY